MSNLVSILLLDTSGHSDASLMVALDAQFHVLSVSSLGDAQAVLTQEAVFALLVPWPQPGLTLAAARALVLEHPKAALWLLYSAENRPQVALGEGVYVCPQQDAPLLLALAAQAAQAEQTLERAQQQLYSNAGAVVLSSIIGGVAHDINNALTVVVGNGELLPPQANEDDQQGVEQIIASAQRAQAMLHTVLMLASDESPQRHWSDARQMILSVMDLVQSLLRRRKIQLELDVAPDLPPIWGEIAQLQQALLHLVHNAIWALQTMPGEKRLVLRAYRVGIAAGDGEDGEGVAIELLDNGPGIAQELQAHVFEPFVTTRPVGAGAGLGLTVAHAIVARAEGSLELLLPEHGGAGFRMTLPLRFPNSQRV